MRGNGLVVPLTKSVVMRFEGVHHIHIYKTLTRLREYAMSSRDFEYGGRSDWFRDCEAFTANRIRKQCQMSRVLHASHRVRTLSRRPVVFDSIPEPLEARLAIQNIKMSFEYGSYT